VVALAELGERVAAHQRAGETALAVGKPSCIPAVDDHTVVGGLHHVVEQVLEPRVRISTQDVGARIEIVHWPIDRELLERVLHPDAAVHVKRFAEVAVALLPEPLRVPGGEAREDVAQRQLRLLGQPALPVLVVEDGARGEVHAMAAFVHENLQRPRRRLAEEAGELRVRRFGHAMRVDEGSGGGRRRARSGLCTASSW
jgi:hypothetical protein